jgi:hypothetical protein
MIERRRHPDGTDTSIDHGCGPMGRRPSQRIGGTALADAVPGKRLGLYPSNPEKAAYKREWEKRHKL